MLKSKLCLLIALLCMALSATGASGLSSEEPVIEIHADRVLIYPQRMTLTGEETLLDLLLMFPDQMQTGFDKMIDAYNLRLDNSPLNGNTRLLCSQLKAKDISLVQICDNTGVAKGTIGMGRVIDINLLPVKNCAHGFVSAQYGTDNIIAPSAQVVVGSENTDIFANASYTYQDKFAQQKNDQYLALYMTNRFSSHDCLQTYFTQQYKDDRAYSANKTVALTKKYSGKASYFHDFNDRGTELLILGSYTYIDIPKTICSETDERMVGTSEKSGYCVVELNTPFYTDKLEMMVGWEGDWNSDTYRSTTTQAGGNVLLSLEHGYTSSNNDFYLQYNYSPTSCWNFTAGARVMMFRYSFDGNNFNDTRHNIITSAIYKPTKNHQIQIGYFHKFFNPSYSVDAVISAHDWINMQGKLVACDINEMKMAYTYSRNDLNVNITSSYFLRKKGNDGWSPDSEDYYYIDDMWKTSATITYHTGMLNIIAGANYYWQKNDDNYAVFTLAPTLSLPCQLQIAPRVVFFTSNISGVSRLAALPYEDSPRTYASLQVNKQLGKHFDLTANWHDIFSSRYSAALIGIQYRF